MKILFLQNYTPNIEPYFKYVSYINSAYCVKHGYDYKASVPNVPNGYHITWCKIFSVMDEMENKRNYDYIFYLDADAIVLNFNITLESKIENMKGDIVFSKNGRNGGDLINTGAFIVKCSPNGKAFIHDVYQASLSDDYKIYQMGHWHEQTILSKLYESGKYDMTVDVFDMNFINSYWNYDPNSNDGQFIFHFMGRKNDKVAVSKKLFDKRVSQG